MAEGKEIGQNQLLGSACFTFAHILLAKGNQMVESENSQAGRTISSHMAYLYVNEEW